MEGRPLSSSSTERLLKVIVIGDLGVGKTSIIRRYVDEHFERTYKATVGVDFSLKTIEWDARTVLRLQFWDIAGQERFKRMSRVYYKGSTGALVVFDVSQRGGPTLRAAADWKRDLDSKVLLDNGDPVPAVLLANKCDMTVAADGDPPLLDLGPSLDLFCKENGFLGWFQTSAKDNMNIDEAAGLLIKHMMLADKGQPDEDRRGGDVIKVSPAPGTGQSQCCWSPRFY